MDSEQEKALGISLNGAERDEALAAFHEQIRGWDQALPAVEPLVLDFGLRQFHSFGLIEYWIANEIDAGYCAKYLFVFDSQSCPMHRHASKRETFFIVKGTVRMDCNGDVHLMNPGGVLLVEPQQPHSFTGVGPALLLEVSTPCIVADNYFEDRRIPLGGNSCCPKGAEM